LGAALGFPAVELHEHGDVVKGLLFTSEVLEEHWARLDDFEGDGYERVVTEVVLTSGRRAEAYIFVRRAS
jgi:gamma-glutamylcyclotransferase (GGCT)/AIG2-like uncharacterized protein YtfP